MEADEVQPDPERRAAQHQSGGVHLEHG